MSPEEKVEITNEQLIFLCEFLKRIAMNMMGNQGQKETQEQIDILNKAIDKLNH